MGATDYTWPPVSALDLQTSAIRVLSAPVAGTSGDSYQVELDAAWIDVYGCRRRGPGR